MKKLSILLMFMLLLACDVNVEFSGATNYIYRNDSDHQIQLEAFVNGDNIFEFSLMEGEEYVYERGPDEGEDNGPIYDTRFGANDSLLVYFNDTLVIQYDKGRVEGNPMKISQYELIESEKEPYVFLFEFTNEDYERALERGRVIK
ncbi:MAG: hypothetical protein ACQETL_06250 [Bacteroidota bacterium]